MMETAHKHEYHVRDISTRSVTLFPSRAQVVREIKDVTLKAGTNEITILGLTPTVDENTIKVEGTGSATITDISYELVPNRDIFQEIYPSSDEEDDEEDEESEDDHDSDDEPKKEDPGLVAVRSRLQVLRDELHQARETIASATTRLQLLNDFGKSSVECTKERDVDVAAFLTTYRVERERVCKEHMEGTLRERQLNKDIGKLSEEEGKLYRKVRKENRKAEKAKRKEDKAKEKAALAKRKEKEKKARREAERLKEKARKRKEREQFWPRSCYTVRISLEVLSGSPTLSRRGSIASEVDLVKETAPIDTPEGSSADGATFSCDLALSYMTSSAFWAPSYDFALSTTSNTGTLFFDAQLTNMTSETWSNCKVTLSTSHTNFSSLDDKVPTLAPWRIKLGGKNFGMLTDDHATSKEEKAAKSSWDAAQARHRSQKGRGELFGMDAKAAPGWRPNFKTVQHGNQAGPPGGPNAFGQPTNVGALFGGFGSAQRPPAPAGSGGGLFGNANNTSPFARQAVTSSSDPFGSNTVPGAGLFGSVAPNSTSAPQQQQQSQQQQSHALEDHQMQLMLLEQQNKKRLMMARQEQDAARGPWDSSGGAMNAFNDPPEMPFNPDDAATMLEPTPELAFQESVIEETGLTTSYDMAGVKTLAPKSNASRQRIAKVSFTNVYFSHTVVAKLKPAAYLKARLRNNSRMTLIKGPTGLTLDGTFLGRTTLPRCSAGDTFNMWLGVDPAIRVVYPKLDIRRSTTGVFNKEYNSAYTRSVTLANTRAASGKAATITVLDQVPVSEDERLRVTITNPRGLVVDAAAVRVESAAVSVAIPSSGNKDKDKKAREGEDWGRATAALKKAGTITWDVSLNPGKSVKLALEYELGMPPGEAVTQV